MQLHKPIMSLAWAIAIAATSQSAVWSFTPNSPTHRTASAGYALALQPVTSGVAASQGLTGTTQHNLNSQPSTLSGQSANRTEPATKSLKVIRYNSARCQLAPQTSGVSVLRQLDALSSCKASN